MSQDSESKSGADAFTRFWTEMMGQMASSGMAASPATPELFEPMRKAFFGVVAEHADAYMRSEHFLSQMKQNLDNALAFKQQFDQYLTKGLQSLQIPSRADSNHIVQLVRGMEERVLARLDDLATRVTALEQATRGGVGEGTDPERKAR